jgi:hypothetical protein
MDKKEHKLLMEMEMNENDESVPALCNQNGENHNGDGKTGNEN